MKLKIYLDEMATTPTRAHETDAGLDLYAERGAVIYGNSAETFDTGVHVEIPVGYAGFLKSKSGLNVKFDITSDGVIDSGYTGSITVKLYNHSQYPFYVNKGDKITQLVILPIETPELELVESLDQFGKSERGDNGFGSTGR